MQPIQFEKFKVWEENINQEDYFNKLVDEKALFEVFPDMVDYEFLDQVDRSIPAYAKSNIYKKDGTLMRMFEKGAKVHNTNKHYVMWQLEVGEGDIRSTFLENVNGNKTQLGANGDTFFIKTDVDWYGPNNVLIVEGIRETPILIKSDPEVHGQGYRYVAQLWTDDDNIFITPEDISPGFQMMQAGGFAGEAQIERSPINFGMGQAYVQFSVPMNRFAFSMRMTDDMQQSSKNFRIRPLDGAGKQYENTPDILYNSFEMKFNATVNYQKDLWMTYGRSAGNYGGKFLDRVTGRELRSGPGLIEFLEASYTMDYNVEGVELLEMLSQFLHQAWHGKVEPSQRNIRIGGGSGFLKVWEKMCAKADQYGIIQTPEYNYSDEDPLFPGRKAVGVGRKQYRSIFLEPFGKITVDYMPIFDNDMVETREYNGYNINSYQAMVLDYGYGEGIDSNIVLMKNPSRENYGYVTAGWSPLGSTIGNPDIARRFTPGLENGSGNIFEYVHECEFGMLVKDPSYMLWLRPNFV